MFNISIAIAWLPRRFDLFHCVDFLPVFLLKVEEAIAIAMAQKRRPIIVKSHMGMNASLENLFPYSLHEFDMIFHDNT